MTVREWYRLQRKSLWDREDTQAADLDRLSEKVIRRDPLDCVEDCWPFKLIMCDVRGYAAHTKAFKLVQQQLQQAMQDMDQELQRRASLERYAKDLPR